MFAKSFENLKVGYAFCASFCTLERSFDEMKKLAELGAQIYPVMSERASSTDSRFTVAKEFKERVKSIAEETWWQALKKLSRLGLRSLLTF